MLKLTGAVVPASQRVFTACLMMSNEKSFRYKLVRESVQADKFTLCQAAAPSETQRRMVFRRTSRLYISIYYVKYNIHIFA